MPGYGGNPSGSPSVPGYNGYTAGMGGYSDPSGQNHPYTSSDPFYNALTNVVGGNQNPYQSNPGYQDAIAREQLGLSQSNAALNNLIQQRIISYGDPALASMAGFGLDPQAAAFARQNYISGNAQLARLDKAHQQNLRNVINTLAAHGILNSGDTGYQTGQEDSAYGNNVYDAQQAALADILGYRNNTLSQQQQLHQSVIDALQNAYNTYVQNPQFYGAATQAQNPPAPKAVSKAAAPAPKPKSKTLSSVLRNPYVTGEKKRG